MHPLSYSDLASHIQLNGVNVMAKNFSGMLVLNFVILVTWVLFLPGKIVLGCKSSRLFPGCVLEATFPECVFSTNLDSV